ncbi:helix-turn-helix domain-containing protein [Acinetobacter shaoyimingii]|uniref:helix-turn-helix domain-containing protein n=1 Tax=Acinetobacter shaoyimingii TaxID=2715164 RepID=UPI0029FF4B99|nr:helix-turn-helix domain-containing protein [Acinetobacter shaoyimingii]
MIEQEGMVQNSQCKIFFKLSQEMFANMFGVSRQTLNKHLQGLLKEHVLQWKQGYIEIFDYEKLIHIGELD